MSGALVLGRIHGIAIRIHYTWLIAFALITWSLAQGFFPSSYPGWATTTYWIMGAVAAIGLFGSVLIHELSHSFMALARGKKVEGITLFIFGGVSSISDEADRPKDELLISIVGPLTSFAIAAAAWLLVVALAPGNTPLGAILGYLALVNLLVGIFNLLPGFPLDGGRVLRSAVWAATGSLRRATEIASYVGQGFGFLLIFWGAWQIFAGDFLNGIWIAFVGWFLNNAAESTRAQQQVKESLDGVRVSDLMAPMPPLLDAATSVQDLVMSHLVRGGARAVLVGRSGEVSGIVSITDIKELDQDQWPVTPLSQIMTPVPLKSVTPDTDVNDALRLLAEHDLHQLPVLVRGQAVGMLSRADIMRFLRTRRDLGLHQMQEPPARRKAA
ncbi:MAG: site-2 protease family protein [Chloroflexota bacterium]